MMGALIDRTGRHAHRLLVVWQCLMAVSGAFIPLAGSLWGLVIAVAVMNFAGGCVDVMGNVLLVKLWADDDVRGAPAMNLLHAAWSAGSTTAPLLARTIGLAPSLLPSVYLAAAIITALLAAPLLRVPPPREVSLASMDAAAHDAPTGDDAPSIAAASSPSTTAPAPSTSVPTSASATPRMTARHYCVMLAMFVFYCCLGAAERIPGDWLTTVVARSPSLHASEEDGASVTSLFVRYWGGLEPSSARVLSLARDYVPILRVARRSLPPISLGGCCLCLSRGGSRPSSSARSSSLSRLHRPLLLSPAARATTAGSSCRWLASASASPRCTHKVSY